MMKRQERIERIVAVHREYLAAAAAMDLLEERLRSDPQFGVAGGWRSRDARKLRESLEATFLLRLCAEFESGLRDAWQNFFHRPTHPPMRDLLIAIATQHVPQGWLAAADAVREYRNTLVHESGATRAEPISLADARRHLCRFFSCLPLDW